MNQPLNESSMSSMNLSPFRRLELDGSGTLTIVHGDTWTLHKTDGTVFSGKEKGFVSHLGDRLRIANDVPGGIMVQGNGGRIGNITNSVIGSIVQNGQPVRVPTIEPYDWVLTCPLLPEDVEMEGVTTLKIDAAPFPHEGNTALRTSLCGSSRFDALCFDIAGSSKLDFAGGHFRVLELDVSGSADVRIALADGAGKASLVRLHVSGSADIALGACPAEKTDIHVSGTANIRLDTGHVSGKVSGSADLLLRKDSLHSNTLRTSGSAQIHYF